MVYVMISLTNFHDQWEEFSLIEDQKVYDITIIGGGPAGLFTAFYGGMRDASVKIIESLPQLGGQLATLYPEKYIYDVAGFPKVKAMDLVNNLKEQISMFSPTVCLGQAVVEGGEAGRWQFQTNNTRGNPLFQNDHYFRRHRCISTPPPRNGNCWQV